MKFKVMSKAGAAAWHEEQFNNEADARAYANQCYKNGCNIIELYAKDRTGYHLVSAHREPWRVTRDRWAEQVAEEAPSFV